MPTFSPKHETLIVVVWVSFLLLPIYFQAKSHLFALPKVIGVLLCIDESTSDLCRPSEAWVCIKVDSVNKLPDKIWIEGRSVVGTGRLSYMIRSQTIVFALDTLGISISTIFLEHHHK